MTDNWFTKFCFSAGKVVHEITKPVEQSKKQPVSKKIEEKKLDDTVTLRRTTIEEIEIKQSDDKK